MPRKAVLEPILLPMQPLWLLCEMEEELTVSLFAEIINSERKSIYRWLECGGLPVVRAEAICDHLGVHPTAVWGEDYFFACYKEEQRKSEIKRIRRQARKIEKEALK
jgi:hypothetical protein